MDGIRTVGMSICVTVVVTALFSMLVPEGKLDRVLKFGISLFFLTGLISPFLSGNLDFHVDMELPTGAVTGEKVTQTVASEFSGMAERNVSAAVERLLLREGWKPKKVDVRIHIDDQGGVFISQMQVVVDSEQRAATEELGSLLERETGVTPEILISEP